MDSPNKEILRSNEDALRLANLEMKNVNRKFLNTYERDDSRTAVLFAYHLFNLTAQLLAKHVSRDDFQNIAENTISQIDLQEALQSRIESIVFREEIK